MAKATQIVSTRRNIISSLSGSYTRRKSVNTGFYMTGYHNGDFKNSTEMARAAGGSFVDGRVGTRKERRDDINAAFGVMATNVG